MIVWNAVISFHREIKLNEQTIITWMNYFQIPHAFASHHIIQIHSSSEVTGIPANDFSEFESTLTSAAWYKWNWGWYFLLTIHPYYTNNNRKCMLFLQYCGPAPLLQINLTILCCTSGLNSLKQIIFISISSTRCLLPQNFNHRTAHVGWDIKRWSSMFHGKKKNRWNNPAPCSTAS